jgi:hypothetical protein
VPCDRKLSLSAGSLDISTAGVFMTFSHKTVVVLHARRSRLSVEPVQMFWI